ncbi:MFS transporter [Isoptericola sp. b441]|uniref:MFS transporter n=1 Tax=Actinotalea lenta TaxID=3064654 RepID=A0ABT9D892_9CELL|nr:MULTISPECIES: MFS transporter [unclassified Isoptericola]MDO8106671.1 MFS transporter [Isoptericola sp. b441]MDO8121621.1 MFS transporter [Isoptericola sp. b490]
MSPTFASLRYPNYRLWFAGALLSNTGTWMQRVAQDWLVLTRLSDNSGVAVGVVTALQFLPTLLLSAWAGVLADRMPRRLLLVMTQLAQGALALGLGALVLSGHAELWHVYVFALLLGVVSAFDGPVRQIFVAELVPADKLPNAVGLNSASFNAARLIGPGLAGLLIAWVGSGWVFVINGLSYAATIFALALMQTSELRELPRAAGGRRGQLREGLRYVRGRSDIMVIMVVMGVVSTFGLNFQLTSAMMARTVFGKGAGEYGILGSVLAIGSLSGALLAARRERPRVRLVLGAALAFGVAMGVQAMMPTYLLYTVMCIPVGLASLTMMTAANSAIQTSTTPQMRGRVMALYMMVFIGATPIGSPIVGWVAEQFGARWSVGIGSIGTLLIAGGAALWARRAWNVEVHYHLRARPHVEVRYLTLTQEREVREEAALALADQRARDDASAA